MKIYPRLLELSPGEDTCHFRIKNASTDDRVLLFKIRRFYINHYCHYLDFIIIFI